MPFGKHLKDSRGLMIVKRYQNRFMHKRRSVGEHMASTAIICQWLAILEYKLFNNTVDMDELLQRAINFNLTQSVTGNMLSSLSKLSPSLEDAKKALKLNAYREYIEPALPKSWNKDFERYVVYAKDSSTEGVLLQAADCIDTILECIDEINLGNDECFGRILIEALDNLDDIEMQSVKYALKYILPKFEVRNEKYKIVLKRYSYLVLNSSVSEDTIKSFDVIANYIYEYRNLMELMRYQNKFMHWRTSDAEHTWSVAKISQGLAIWTRDKFNTEVDMANVICRALSHDFSEVVIGDILSTTKRMTDLMKKAVDEMEEVAFQENIVQLIPECVLADFKSYILDPKGGGVEGRIIAAADIIDTIFECAEEVKLGNREVFLPVLQKVTRSLISVELEAVDYFFLNSLEDIGLDIIDYGVDVYYHIENLKAKYGKFI